VVVREGVTPVNALKKGLQGLDNPNLIGVVLNEVLEFDRGSEYERYYLGERNGKNGRSKENPAEDTA